MPKSIKPRSALVPARSKMGPGPRCGLAAVLSISLAQPAWAGGSITTGPNTTVPTAPAPYKTNTQDLAGVGSGGCQSQYNASLNAAAGAQLGLQGGSLTAQGLSLGLKSTAQAIDTGAITTEAVVSFINAGADLVTAIGDAVPLWAGGSTPGDITQAADDIAKGGAAVAKETSTNLKTAALVADGVKLALDTGSYSSSIYQNAIRNYLQGTGAFAGLGGLPNCDTKFNGTITVLDPAHAPNGGGVPAGQPGLIIQSGDAYIGGNIYSGGNFNIGGTITASTFNVAQGFSAYGGAITLGNPDLVSYQPGISIG